MEKGNKTKGSKTKGRAALLINFSSVISLIVVFEIIKNTSQKTFLVILLLALLAISISSFINAFIQTGSFKFVHTKFEKLDERETQLVGNALRYSYSFFTIAVLVIIYVYALAENEPIDVVIAAGLLYFAHTLPAAFLTWWGRTN